MLPIVKLRQEVINKILFEDQKPIPEIYSPFLQQLVKSLLQKDQYKRPPIDKILMFPEIAKYVLE